PVPMELRLLRSRRYQRAIRSPKIKPWIGGQASLIGSVDAHHVNIIVLAVWPSLVRQPETVRRRVYIDNRACGGVGGDAVFGGVASVFIAAVDQQRHAAAVQACLAEEQDFAVYGPCRPQVVDRAADGELVLRLSIIRHVPDLAVW